MTLTKSIAMTIVFLAFATICVTSSHAQNQQPTLPPSGQNADKPSKAQQTINRIKQRVMPTDSTEQDQRGARDSDSYAPMYIVTRVQSHPTPGYFKLTNLNAFVTGQQNLAGFANCDKDEQTNDTVKRIKFSPIYIWWSSLRAGGCTSPAICGHCITWNQAWTASCNPEECGNQAFYLGDPRYTTDKNFNPDLRSGSNTVPYQALPKTGHKYCGGNSGQVFGGFYAYGEEVDADTPLSNEVKDVLIRRTCFYTEWAKTN